MVDTSHAPETGRYLMSDSVLPDSIRRTVLKSLAAGAALLTAGSGTTAGSTPGKRPPVIDENLGYTQWDPDERVPFKNKVDETVEVTQRAPSQNPSVPTPEETSIEFFFNPVGLHVDPGDVVEFSVQAGHHAVGSYHPDNDRQRRIPPDAPSFSSPMLGGYGNESGDPVKGGKSQSWFYEFETPGVYDMYCPPHEVYGMVMRVVVGDVTETDFGPVRTQFLPPLGFANSVFGKSELKPDNIRTQEKVPWDALFEDDNENED